MAHDLIRNADRFYNLHGNDFVIKRGEGVEESAAPQSRPKRGKGGRMLAPQRPQDKHAEMVRLR